MEVELHIICLVSEMFSLLLIYRHVLLVTHLWAFYLKCLLYSFITFKVLVYEFWEDFKGS